LIPTDPVIVKEAIVNYDGARFIHKEKHGLCIWLQLREEESEYVGLLVLGAEWQCSFELNQSVLIISHFGWIDCTINTAIMLIDSTPRWNWTTLFQ
jgi:hypothetical protein